MYDAVNISGPLITVQFIKVSVINFGEVPL